MAENISKNKRILKNTLLLYIRSIIVMVVTLYTSRVILHALGISDYGLYNVIAGVVALFSFLRTSMTKSTQRFLNVEMTNPHGHLRDVFSVSLSIHVIIAVIAFALAETLGLWFLNEYVQIPEGREWAANMVYQSTVLSLVVTIISVPYNACIIAHEKMGYFAIVSIIDCVLRLVICYLIMTDITDRLILYGWLSMLVSVADLLMYALYCFRYCKEASVKMMYDRQLYKEMLGYTTWTVVGQVAIVGTNQGNNILVNIFHSVSANAAMGIASQVNSAVVSLTSNFQTAFNPQITKSFAAKEYTYLKSLVYNTSKISYYMLLIVSLPIMLNIDSILTIWLKEVPVYAGVFCILVLCNSILNALSAPLNFCVLSSKKIKWFQIITSVVYLSDLIILFILFKCGFPPYTALAVKVAIMVAVLFVRLFYANREVECINLKTFFLEVIFPLSVTTVISVIIGLLLFLNSKSVTSDIISSIILLSAMLVVIYTIGLSSDERSHVIRFINRNK